MCTEHAGVATRQHSTDVAQRRGLTRRAALVGTATVVASTALTGTAVAGEVTPPPQAWGRRGLRDLTYPLTTTFPSFAPGEEASRSTYVTIEEDGYYLQEWHLFEHTGTHVDAGALHARWPPGP